MPMFNATGKTYKKIIEDSFRRSQIMAGFVQVFQQFALEFDQGIRYANETVRCCQIFYRNPIVHRLHGGPPRLALPCLALPCLALPCLALPCLALPGQARPASPP